VREGDDASRLVWACQVASQQSMQAGVDGHLALGGARLRAMRVEQRDDLLVGGRPEVVVPVADGP
jgi:hypothetical protein